MKKRVCILIAVLCLLNATDVLFACGWQPGSVYIDAKLTVSQNWGYPGDIVIFDASQSTATSGYVIKSYKFIVFRNGVYSHDYTEDSTLRDGKFDYKYSCYFSGGGSYTAVVEVTAEKNGQQEKETSNQVGVTIDGSDGCIAYMPFTQESYNAYNCSNPSLTDSRYFDVGDYSNNNSGRFRAWFAGYISWWDSVNNCIDPIKSKLFPSRKVNDHPNYATQAGDMVSFMQNDMCNNPPTYNAPSWENYLVDYQWIEVDPVYGDNSGNKRFSTVVWVKPSGLQNQPIAQRTGWLVCLEPVNDAYKVHFYINGTVDLDSESTINQNTWAHVACTYDGLVKRIYINGNLDTELADTGAVIPYGSKLQIGKEYKGYMDEFYLCKKTISPESIVSKASLGTKGWKSTAATNSTNPFDSEVKTLTLWQNNLVVGTKSHGVYKWNGSQWVRVGNSNPNNLNALCQYGEKLYAGTDFGLYELNNSTGNWVEIKYNNSSIVKIKALIAFKEELFIGGDFTLMESAYEKFVDYMVRWTPSGGFQRVIKKGQICPKTNWPINCYGPYGEVNVFAINPLNPDTLFVAGTFAMAEVGHCGCSGDVHCSDGSTRGLALWQWNQNPDNCHFSPIGDYHVDNSPFMGDTISINTIAFCNNKLYIGGDFDRLELTSCPGTGSVDQPSIPANGLAYFDYDDNTWHGMGVSLAWTGSELSCADNRNKTFSMVEYNCKLIVAGKFVKVGANADNTGGVTVSNIAAWDGSNWSTLGTGVGNTDSMNPSTRVESLAVVGNELYIGGYDINRSGSNYHAIKNFAIWENP